MRKLILAAALVGCTGVTDGPEPELGRNDFMEGSAAAASLDLLTDRETYTLGQSGVVSLVNTLPSRLPYGLLSCGPRVERRDGDDWVAGGQFNDVCVLVGHPGHASGERIIRAFVVEPPLFARGGEYRIAVQFPDPANSSSTMVVRSNSFMVD